MKAKEVYLIWAPLKRKWSSWVKPVIFMNIEKANLVDFNLPKINYLNNALSNQALIIDLPNVDSVLEGLSLNKLGFWPVPLYNGTDPQDNAISLVNNNGIKEALFFGSFLLRSNDIDLNAPPAFLVDSKRLLRYKMDISLYDNSWDLYGQDLPSPKCFLNQGINKIIVRSDKLNRDLKVLLYNYQKQGLKIMFTKGYEKPILIKLKKPPKKDKYH